MLIDSAGRLLARQQTAYFYARSARHRSRGASGARRKARPFRGTRRHQQRPPGPATCAPRCRATPDRRPARTEITGPVPREHAIEPGVGVE